MKSRISLVAPIVAVLTWGCGTTPEPPVPAGGTETSASETFEQPFTAEQIREEWIPGLRLLMKRTTPEGSRIERWTVITADEVGADIEYAIIADDGSVTDQPRLEFSTWNELRDHAEFPADNATREWVTRETALGEYEGWLYRVTGDEASIFQEFFFVPEMPGAPVQMRIVEGDTTIFELEQTARLRPETD